MLKFKRNLLGFSAAACFCITAAFTSFADETTEDDIIIVELTETEQEQTAPPKVKARSPQKEEGFVDSGPGVAKKDEPKEVSREISLGEMTITGYCNCELCTKGHKLTYSGVVPTPGHTISADLSQFPLGTKLKIDGIVYTVEDKGSSVVGRKLDIFYATHEEALANGTYSAEVFLITDETEE